MKDEERKQYEQEIRQAAEEGSMQVKKIEWDEDSPQPRGNLHLFSPEWTFFITIRAIGAPPARWFLESCGSVGDIGSDAPRAAIDITGEGVTCSEAVKNFIARAKE